MTFWPKLASLIQKIQMLLALSVLHSSEMPLVLESITWVDLWKKDKE